MTRIALIAALTAMAGCATDPATMQAAMDAQAKARPTLAVTCPAGGCTVEYTDPRDRNVRLPTNGWDAAMTISGQVTSLIGGAVVPAAMGIVAVEGFRAMRGHGAQTTTTTTDSRDMSSITDSHDTTTTTTTDSTHTPTVVTQPAPIVVEVPTP